MWFNFDILKFALKLLPPVLRRGRLFSFLRVLLMPLVNLHTTIMEYVRECEDNIRINGQVIYIEKALKDYFLLDNDDIYITEYSSISMPVYFRNSPPYQYISNDADNPLYISNETVNSQLRFIVNVPAYLSERIDVIESIIEFNKPAGRQYTINIYEL